MLVYLSGPMRGFKDLNFPAFDKARDFWIVKGHAVISPADMDRQDPVNPLLDHMNTMRIYARRDLTHIVEHVDAVVMLDNWEKSRGALAELMVALWVGLKVFDERGKEMSRDELMYSLAQAWDWRKI